ncbi:hypothetical protein ACFVU3_05250 [Streptomyces sp. NPDC058052]|uniref:hypothetical protein n=1 Tax=Streptomyces sp. NPDC058052 TaxID=3346316 RepID=UPI0036EDC36D
MIHEKSGRGTALAVAVLAALAVSCTTTPEPDGPAPGGDAPGGASATRYPNAAYAPSAGEDVRGAFATLQATLSDSCAKDCGPFLGRVNKELQELEGAMRNDPKGPGHFPEPIRRIGELNGALAGDSSFENLEKHRAALLDTRGFVNTWMQDHPDDYR